jgi:hypothetical protein
MADIRQSYNYKCDIMNYGLKMTADSKKFEERGAKAQKIPVSSRALVAVRS